MDISSMKNIVVLKNLPSNLVEEAIVVLKENKKVKKYEYAEGSRKKDIDTNKENVNKTVDNSEYIVKEAENVISQYITNLEMKSPRWKNNMKKLEKKYKQSLKLNFVLGGIAFVSILFSLL